MPNIKVHVLPNRKINYNIRQINKNITPLTDLYFHLKQWNKESKERKYPCDKEYINSLRYMQVYL